MRATRCDKLRVNQYRVVTLLTTKVLCCDSVIYNGVVTLLSTKVLRQSCQLRY